LLFARAHLGRLNEPAMHNLSDVYLYLAPQLQP